MTNFRRANTVDYSTSHLTPLSAGQHMGDNYHGPITGNVVVAGGQGNTYNILPTADGPNHPSVLAMQGQSQLNPIESEKLLQTLPGWDLEYVRFDESKGCLGKTRQQLIDNISTWVHSSHTKRILWISGGAGTGKSSVAHSCAALFDERGQLGASFFFNRDTAGLNSPKHLIANLCYQLAHFDRQLNEKILAIIQTMGHITASPLRTQARKLIVSATTEAKLVGPVVLVVDAVDEAGSKEMREPLLDAIATEFTNLPDTVKVIVTSRDEQDIRIALQACSDEICIEKSEKTTEDIASYIQHRLAKIRQRSGLAQSWPSPEKLRALCVRAGRLFVWASAACSFIECGFNHTRQLNELLDLKKDKKEPTTSPLSKLHSLYNHILETAFPIHEGHRAEFYYVVGSVIALEVPLTRIELDTLLGFTNDSDEDGLVLPNGHTTYLSSSAVIINRLRSILREDSTNDRGEAGPIRLLHPSLYDFLTTHAKTNFRIDVMEQHRTLAIRCLDVMNNQLKFDICEIGDPSLLNEEIPDPRWQTPAELRYSCHSFVYHIAKVLDPNSILINAVEEFVCEHMLHWIEAMSLMNAVSKAEECLYALSVWMKDHPGVGELSNAIVCDAIALLRNCGQAVRLSALQTYYSALPLTPKTRKLFEHYVGKVPGIPNVISSHPIWPAASVRILEGHKEDVICAIFSPDGKKLVSASRDNTLRLWDVETGQPIGEALTGHTSWVHHVVFSPDGKKLASASRDGTLRLWDVETGQPIGNALTGHKSWVNRVVFSPDGKKLASTSDDRTLRLWDVETMQSIGEPLTGHLWVKHVVFSPDGKKLASALGDKTLRIWDVETRLPIGETLTGHTWWVNDVVFSPDGTKLASASGDKTLRLWDVETRLPIGQTLTGHASSVNHVVFSPDGTKLASASGDETLRLWDVESGQPIGEPLTGHTGQVNYVVFSPDGKKLASASGDKTLRLWDVETGQLIGEPLTGHTMWVQHVMFSPDGKKLASASGDKTLRLWDVENGRPIGETLTGHMSWVSHVVFSPDGKKLASASGDNTLRLWDVKTGLPIREALTGHRSSVNHVVFSPDGKKLASASDDGMLRLWDIENGQSVGEVLTCHTTLIICVVFSPDGKKLASASMEGTFRLWDVENGQPIGEALAGYKSWVNHVVFSPDGKKLVSAERGCALRLWDVETGQSIGEPLTGHGLWVKDVVFSLDGTKLASAEGINTLRLWDVKTGLPVGETLTGHTSWVNHVVFSPDGKKLASASDDGMLRLWDVEIGQPIGEALTGHTSLINHVVFSPDGKKLASASDDKTLRLWDVENGQQIKETPTSSVDYVMFSLDGKKVILVSAFMALLLDIESHQITEESSSTFTLHDTSHPILFFDELGFLRCSSKRLMWLPFFLRGCVALHQSSAVIGSPSGAVSFIRWPLERSS